MVRGRNLTPASATYPTFRRRNGAPQKLQCKFKIEIVGAADDRRTEQMACAIQYHGIGKFSVGRFVECVEHGFGPIARTGNQLKQNAATATRFAAIDCPEHISGGIEQDPLGLRTIRP